MTTIGIIGAFDAEVEKLIEIFELKKEDDKDEIYIGIFEDKKLVVARSGIGKVNSAATTQKIIDIYTKLPQNNNSSQIEDKYQQLVH